MDPTNMYLQWLASRQRQQQQQAMSASPHPAAVQGAMQMSGRPAPAPALPEGYSPGGPGSQYAPSSDPNRGTPHIWGMLSGRRRPW